jgi:phenylalanyl-tRNA synthetase beta chain
MRVSYSWLLKHIDIDSIELKNYDKKPSNIIEKIADVCTNIGHEVESIKKFDYLYDFVVAEILSAERHPNSDKLQVCLVSDGAEKYNVVCGASNARPNIKVVLAKIGTKIPSNDMVIKKSKIRDIESEGMMCSYSELCLEEYSKASNNDDGIIELDSFYEIGRSYGEYIDDPVLNISITPNRGDVLGIRGLAMDLSAAGVGKLKNLENINNFRSKTMSEKKENFNPETKFHISEKCHGVSYREIKNIVNKESPEWLRLSLAKIGQRSISALVDISNYVMFDLCRPSHIFDLDKIDKDLFVDSLLKEEEFIALDNTEYKVPSGSLVIRDKNKIHSIVGIKGGLHSSCIEETKNILLEMINVSPETIASTGQKLCIISEARSRFERGVDPEIIPYAMEAITKLIIDICGTSDTEISDIQTEGTISKENKKILWDQDMYGYYIHNGKDNHEEVLSRLGFKKMHQDLFEDFFEVPSHRNDCSIPQDLIEEVARINGYSDIESIKPSWNKPYGLTRSSMQNAIDTCIHAGLSESVSFTFIPEQKWFDNGPKIANPMSVEMSNMRTSLLPSLLSTVRKHQNEGQDRSLWYEIGPVFNNSDSFSKKHMAAIGWGSKHIEIRSSRHDLEDGKSILVSVLNCMNIYKFEIFSDGPDWYHPVQKGRIMQGRNTIADFGIMNPILLKELDIKGPVWAWNIYLDNFSINQKPAGKFVTNNLQSVSRDFACIVPSDTKYSSVEKCFKNVHPLLSDIILFDNYKIDEEKKSLGITLIFQPKEKSMTEDDFANMTSNVIYNLSKIGCTIKSS